MDIKKSTRIALAQRGKNMVWLAEQMNTSRQAVYQLVKRKAPTPDGIVKLAAAFGMRASEFIALAEFDDDEVA